MAQESNRNAACAALCTTGSLCKPLKDAELRAVVTESHRMTMARGDVMAADIVAHFPILCIAAGILAVRHTQANGNATIAAFFSAGDIIDLRGAPPDMLTSLTALASTRLCHIGAPLFDKILTANPDAQKIAWRSLRQQAHRVMTQRAEMSKKTSVERLAWFIAEFFFHPAGEPARKISGAGARTVRMPFRQCDLAEFLGQQPETISRGFRQLGAAGILHHEGRSLIRITDPEQLDRLAYGEDSHLPRQAPTPPRILCSG